MLIQVIHPRKPRAELSLRLELGAKCVPEAGATDRIQPLGTNVTLANINYQWSNSKGEFAFDGPSFMLDRISSGSITRCSWKTNQDWLFSDPYSESYFCNKKIVVQGPRRSVGRSWIWENLGGLDKRKSERGIGCVCMRPLFWALDSTGRTRRPVARPHAHS